MRYTPRHPYFTDEQIRAAMAAWGTDRLACTDPDALDAGAAIEAAAARRIEAGAVPGPDLDPAA